MSVYFNDLRKAKDTRVRDLGLDKSSGIQLELSTYFKANSIGTLGVPSSLTRGFKISIDTVIVRSSIVVQVVGGMDSDTIVSSRVSDSSIITANLNNTSTEYKSSHSINYKSTLLFNFFLPFPLIRCKQHHHQQGILVDQRQC